MKLVFIIGNAATGKMTVGQELSKITDLRLFHNHMMIEPVLEIFGDFNSKVIKKLRDVIFEEFASSAEYGLIFTYMWAFDQKSDWAYVQHVCDKFQEAEIYFVELITSQEIRLERNQTENRLKHKVSKRDIEASQKRLLNDDAKHRCVSYEGEIPYKNYLRIDNSNLAPSDVAVIIKEKFSL